MLIDQTNLNGTTLVSFKQFINNFLNYPLIIPNNYQRDYKWAIPMTKSSKPALQVFLEDFYTGLSSDKYFVLGNIVCVASDSNNKVFHLADGQQRVTTMFILLLEILKRDPEYLTKRSNSYLFNDDNKLWLRQSNSDWNDLFQDTLLSNTEDALLNISAAQKIVNSFIDSCKDFDLTSWRDYLLNKVRFNLQWIPLECEEDYFKDVNNKGVILNTVDSLKSDILSLYPKDKGESLWCEFTLEVNKFRSNPLASRFTRLEESLLVHALFISDASELSCSSITKLSEYPKNILEVAIEYLQYINGNDPYVYIIEWLKNVNMLCCYYKLIKNGFFWREAFGQCIKLFYSNIFTAGSVRTTISRELEAPCNIQINSADPRFVYGNNKPNIKLVLFIIEAYLREGDWINNLLFLVQNSKDATLEHIQSQQFGGSNSLGNLTLLSKSDNSKLNKSQEKYSIYKNSNFLITRCLCKEYIPNDDNIRKDRAFYLPSMSSEELDRFNEENARERFENINKFLNEILS